MNNPHDTVTERAPNLLPLLSKIAIEHNFKNCDIQVTPISSCGANYSSLLYLVDITGEAPEELHLFAKVAILGESMRSETDIRPFDTERFFYTKLVPTYRQMEDRHGLAEENRLRVPKYYGADWSYLKEIVVFENLARRGFGPQDRMKSVDWEYAAAGVTELAKFHALSLAYAHENVQEFEDVAHRFRHRIFKDTEGNNTFYNNGVKCALEAVREENKDKLKAFLDKHNAEEIGKFINTNRRPVLSHGDFRPSNMMHKQKSTIQYGSPVIDLLYFIFTATDGAARAQFYNKLIEHYHSELGRAQARFQLDVEVQYPEEDFQQELQEKLSYGLLIGVLVLPIITVDAEDAPKLDADLDYSSMVVSTGNVYKERLNGLVDDFVTMGLLA